MFRLYEVKERYAGPNEISMVSGLKTTKFVALLLAACFLVPVAVSSRASAQASAEDDSEPAVSISIAPEDAELKADILENYRVLLLQEGLLLESRQEGAAAGAIEVSEDTLSVDGELIDAGDLEDLIGADADLIARLTELDADRLHLIFAAPYEAPSEVEESEVAEMWAPESDRPSRAPRVTRHRRLLRHSEPKVALGSGLTVKDDEIVKGNVTVFGGLAIIRGEVKGDVVVFGNMAQVEGGKVHGDVTAIGGSVSLDSDAEVMGSAVSVGGDVERHEDAVIHGEIVEVPFGPNLSLDIWPGVGKLAHSGSIADFRISPFKRTMKIMWQIFSVLLIGLLGCLVLLLAPRPLQRVERKVITEPWKSGLVGFLAQILFAPLLVLVIVVLCLSIIGIPLLILIPFAILALLLLSFLGYAAVALRLGRWAEQRFGWNFGGSYVALLVGVILINGWSIAGEALSWGWGPLKIFAFMFFAVSFVFCYVAWTLGFGATLLTRFGTAEGWSSSAAPVVPPPPVPPVTPVTPVTPEPPNSAVIDLDEGIDQLDESAAVDQEGQVDDEISEPADWADETTNPGEPDDAQKD
jgi:hypothetical protein